MAMACTRGSSLSSAWRVSCPLHPSRHRQIQNHHIKSTTQLRCCFVNLDGHPPLLRQLHGVAHPREAQPDQFPHLLLVIHHQHPRRLRHIGRYERSACIVQFPVRWQVDVEAWSQLPPPIPQQLLLDVFERWNGRSSVPAPCPFASPLCFVEKYGSKIFGSTSWAIPGPWSAMLIRT